MKGYPVAEHKMDFSNAVEEGNFPSCLFPNHLLIGGLSAWQSCDWRIASTFLSLAMGSIRRTLLAGNEFRKIIAWLFLKLVFFFFFLI